MLLALSFALVITPAFAAPPAARDDVVLEDPPVAAEPAPGEPDATAPGDPDGGVPEGIPLWAAPAPSGAVPESGGLPVADEAQFAEIALAFASAPPAASSTTRRCLRSPDFEVEPAQPRLRAGQETLVILRMRNPRSVPQGDLDVLLSFGDGVTVTQAEPARRGVQIGDQFAARQRFTLRAGETSEIAVLVRASADVATLPTPAYVVTFTCMGDTIGQGTGSFAVDDAPSSAAPDAGPAAPMPPSPPSLDAIAAAEPMNPATGAEARCLRSPDFEVIPAQPVLRAGEDTLLVLRMRNPAGIPQGDIDALISLGDGVTAVRAEPARRGVAFAAQAVTRQRFTLQAGETSEIGVLVRASADIAALPTPAFVVTFTCMGATLGQQTGSFTVAGR
jgi:hypothetical protein